MILGRVVGSLWATRKPESLAQRKLLLVRPHASYRLSSGLDQIVAVDTLDAGVGDDVVVCIGSPARWSLGSGNLPLDAAVMAIVDRVELDAG
ncbi:MAG: EutN/CcmL family microcompartment protein [Myxococcales bacterium]|nr:EutN/CcmL family microcompartment protein [Myxococcales bacterium]